MLTRFSLRLRIFLFFALLALGGSALVIAGLIVGYIRLGETHALNASSSSPPSSGSCSTRARNTSSYTPWG